MCDRIQQIYFSGNCEPHHKQQSMSEQMTGAQATVAQLAAQGVRMLLTVPGIHTLPICDAALDVPQLRLIHGRHEQGIAFMDNGYARAGC